MRYVKQALAKYSIINENVNLGLGYYKFVNDLTIVIGKIDGGQYTNLWTDCSFADQRTLVLRINVRPFNRMTDAGKMLAMSVCKSLRTDFHKSLAGEYSYWDTDKIAKMHNLTDALFRFSEAEG
jgi:hypothetical protein